jgi:hypothetical protein
MALFQELEVSPPTDPSGVLLSLRGAFPDSYITVPQAAPSPVVPLADNQPLDIVLEVDSQISAAAALSLGLGQYFDLSASASLTFFQCNYMQAMRIPPDQGVNTVVQNFYYGVGFRILIAVSGLDASANLSAAGASANIELNALSSSMLVQAYGLSPSGLALLSPLLMSSGGGFGAAAMASYIEAKANLIAMLSTRKDASGTPVALYPRLVAVDLDTTDYDIYSRAAVGLMAMKQIADSNATQVAAASALGTSLGGKMIGSSSFDPNGALNDLFSAFYTLCGDPSHAATTPPSSPERTLAKNLVG